MTYNPNQYQIKTSIYLRVTIMLNNNLLKTLCEKLYSFYYFFYWGFFFWSASYFAYNKFIVHEFKKLEVNLNRYKLVFE